MTRTKRTVVDRKNRRTLEHQLGRKLTDTEFIPFIYRRNRFQRHPTSPAIILLRQSHISEQDIIDAQSVFWYDKMLKNTIIATVLVVENDHNRSC